ncbi:MAG: UbiA family prenyltransferase [Polyangiales bacterium]
MTSTVARWLLWARVAQWRHFLLLPLAGVDLAEGVAGNLSRLARAECACASVLAFGYLLNASRDRAMDLDPAKNPLAAEAPRDLTLPLALLALTATLFAASVSPLALCAAGASLASGWCYSAGPRLKSVPLVGTAMNVTNFAPLLFVGAASARDLARLAPLALGFSALLVQNQLLHEAADADEDARGAVTTTFRAYGAWVSALLAALCAGALVSAAVLSAASPWPAAVVGAVAPLTLALEPSAAVAHRARRAHRALSVVAGAALFAACVYRAR